MIYVQDAGRKKSDQVAFLSGIWSNLKAGKPLV